MEESLFCFYGAWNRKDNSESLVWFIKNVLPQIDSNLNKKIKYHIIGDGLNKNLISLAESNKIEYLGFVDNPVIEISKCQALIAPLLHGVGVKVKVIDALTSGTKVIGTCIAFEGISDNQNTRLLYECNSLNEFCETINTWKTDCIETKYIAAKEFHTNYNKEHFSDILIKKIRKNK